MKEFNLLSGEKIVYHTKPLPELKWFFFVRGVVLWIPTIFLFGAWALLIPFYMSLYLLGFMLVTVLTLFLVFIFYLIAINRYENRYYWITNRRVIYKHGLLGYSINSIPLERISDVIVSRTFFERMFSIGSVHIQSLAGQRTAGWFGAEASFNAIPEPEKTQKLILELVKKNRKRERLTI